MEKGDAAIQSKLDEHEKALADIKVKAAIVEAKVDSTQKSIEQQGRQLDRIETILESRPR